MTAERRRRSRRCCGATATSTAPKPALVTDDRAITYAELDADEPRARRRGSSPPGWARARGSGC